MSTRPRRLQRRLMGVLALFTLAVAGLFGLYAMAFMYATEDAFFSAMLQQEAAAQYAARERSGRWSTPAPGFMHVYENTGELPDGLDQLLAAEPQRHELPGRDGRYRVSQGREVGHDARLDMRVDADGEVWSGGQVVSVVRGQIDWP